MNISKDVRYKAKNLLLEYNISKIALENLIYIIEDQGFEIIEYSQRDRSDSVWTVLNTLNLTAYAESGKAFAYKCGKSKLLFVCEEMTADEKLYALAHEEGHIIFGHLCNGACDGNAVEEEYVANEFAHYLLHPPLLLKFATTVKSNKKKALWVALIVLSLAVIIPLTVNIIQSRSYYGEYYITESGTKYNEKHCMTIKDRSNVRRLTEKDYYSGDYEPCHVCLPD
jgi:Zn-dependent peptidase ImmA (M78 family)